MDQQRALIPGGEDVIGSDAWMNAISMRRLSEAVCVHAPVAMIVIGLGLMYASLHRSAVCECRAQKTFNTGLALVALGPMLAMAASCRAG